MRRSMDKLLVSRIAPTHRVRVLRLVRWTLGAAHWRIPFSFTLIFQVIPIWRLAWRAWWV